eukprot:4890752-Amphidinium_carterae.1
MQGWVGHQRMVVRVHTFLSCEVGNSNELDTNEAMKLAEAAVQAFASAEAAPVLALEALETSFLVMALETLCLLAGQLKRHADVLEYAQRLQRSLRGQRTWN